MNENKIKLIHHFLENSASIYPDKVAFIHDDVRETYETMNFKANNLAAWLIEHGVEKGNRIVMLFENCLEYVISYYGILKAGAVAVPFNSELKPDSLRPLLEDIEADIIITSSRFERLLKATGLEPHSLKALIISRSKLNWSESSIHTVDFESIICDKDSNSPEHDIDTNDLASIIYTSGSTGTPKGVMLSHKNIVANTKSICEYLKLTEKDIQMVVLPFFYVMGKSLLNTHFHAGGTIVVNNKFAYPATVIQQMIDEKVTGFSGVPSTYAYLLHRSPFAARIGELTRLRYCSQAGGHMAKQVKKELRELLPQTVDIYIMYGATEASARLSYLEPARLIDKIDSIGKAIPGVVLNIVDQNGQNVEDGQTGELVGKGDNIMRGYWKDNELTSSVLDNNGYHTSDLCYRDTEGYFYLVGRKDDMMKVGGHKINPQEIEDALVETNLVVETAVVGIPDDLLTNRLVAIVVAKGESCTENKLLNALSHIIPKFKLPSQIIFVKFLPKKTSGKIDKIKCTDIVKL